MKNSYFDEAICNRIEYCFRELAELDYILADHMPGALYSGIATVDESEGEVHIAVGYQWDNEPVTLVFNDTVSFQSSEIIKEMLDRQYPDIDWHVTK